MFYIYDTTTRAIVHGSETLTRSTWIKEQNFPDHKIIESLTKVPLKTEGTWIVNNDLEVEQIT